MKQSVKIGVIRTSSIGDVVLSSACLQFFKMACPDAEVIWVGREPSLSLLRGSFESLTLMPWPSRCSGKTYSQIFQTLEKCDVVIDLQSSLRSRWLDWRLSRRQVKVVVCPKFYWQRTTMVLMAWLRGRVLKSPPSVRRTPRFQFSTVLATAKMAISTLENINFSHSIFEGLRPTLSGSHSENLRIDQGRSSWRQELNFGHWMAVAPGASHATKMAPTDVVVDVLEQFKLIYPDDATPPGLLILGSREDRPAAVDLVDNLRWPGPVLNLAGRLQLEETLVAMSAIKILLCNDSGLAHMAEAIGTPVAVLFGPTVEAFGFAPVGPESRSFSSVIGCRPCSKHGSGPCRFKDQLCFRTIDVRMVARFLMESILRSHS